MSHRWLTVYSNERNEKKFVLFLFFPKQRATVSPAFMPSSPMPQSFYYVEEYFSLKQSRQKKTFHNQNRRFYFFAVARFSRSSQHSIFGHRARIREKKLEISFSYLANTTYKMKKSEKVTWTSIQLVEKNDSLCGNTKKKMINNR